MMIEHPDAITKKIDQEKIERANQSVLGFFVRRMRITIILTAVIVLLGFYAVTTLQREADPEVKIPIAIVTTVFPGASPLDVEDLVTNEVESKLESLENLDEITSTSALGISTVVVEFQAEADLEESIRKLKDKVDEVSDLPDDAADPVVTEVRANDFAIVTFSLIGDLTDEELKRIGKDVQDELEKINDVSRVNLIGAREREFSVEVNRGALDRSGVTLNQVISSIQQANHNFPLGSVDVDGINYNVRTVGKFLTGEELGRVAVGDTSSGQVLLRDVAEVKDQLAKAQTLSRISLKGSAPQPTVSLSVYKKTGGDIISIVDRARAAVEDMQARGSIPETVRVDVTNDNSQFIRDDLKTLGRSGIQTVFLILILLSIVLNRRKAIITAIAIPLIFFMALFIVKLQGGTLNSLTLFSLVLSLGLLVDTSIIILEGIQEGLRKGYSPKDSALLSVQTYLWPVTAGVLTTISAFVPMLLVSGILGEYLKVLPITISSTLGSSLFIALVLLPGFIGWSLSKVPVEKQLKHTAYNRFIDWLERKYRLAMDNLMNFKQYRKRLIAIVGTAFVAAMAILIIAIPVEMFPQVDIDFFYVEIELPAGTVLEETEKVVADVERRLREIPEIESFVTSVGAGGANTFNFGSSASNNSHLASITINLIDEKDRDKASYEVAKNLREQLSAIQGGRIVVDELNAGPPTGAPVEIRIIGDDLAVLNQLSREVVAMLESIEGVIEIESDEKISPPEFAFSLDQEKLGQYGLTSLSVGSVLRSAIYGFDATTVTAGDEDIEVVVRYPESILVTPEDVKNIEVNTPTGETIKLQQIADFNLTPALENIRHTDLKRIVNVRAQNEAGIPISQVLPRVEKGVAAIAKPAGHQIVIGGEVE
ncbi:MAG: hypothetical protein COT81_04850, partial [Candidatus Buchananbacteria bacterium CG10_big_fil_rev_8_21_14_0_10_42_9]